jgi:hypothetical protein
LDDWGAMHTTIVFLFFKVCPFLHSLGWPWDSLTG